MAFRPRITAKKKQKFIEYLAEYGNVSRACASVAASRTGMYEAKKHDPEFSSEWDKAHELGLKALEDEAIRRATEGVDEPIYYQGEQVGAVRRYSDTLLIFLLKGGMPEKYRERVEHSGSLDIANSILDARKRLKINTDNS